MGASMREDYLLRQIRAAVDAIARLAGLRTAGRFEAAQLVMDSAYRALLGADADLFSRMDSATGARLLTVPEKMAVMADLLHEEAETLRCAAGGDGRDADRRALEYALEAVIADPVDGTFRALVRKLASGVRGEALDPRHREALDGVLKEFRGFD